MNKLRVLFLDIETSPLISYTWALFDQNLALNQIKDDWCVLSFAAKWLGDPDSKVVYYDQRHKKDVRNDKELLRKVWKLLDKAQVVVTQNGKKFDIKKLNARFILNGMKPPSSFRQLDTLQIAKKHFAFTSNKLEYLTSKLCTKYKKSGHKKFPGFELWKECMAGNNQAWDEMKNYNILDILSLEELYNKLIPWDNSINFNVYSDDLDHSCKCGSKSFLSKGYAYTNNGKYKRFICKQCGACTQSKQNLLTKEKRASLRK